MSKRKSVSSSKSKRKSVASDRSTAAAASPVQPPIGSSEIAAPAESHISSGMRTRERAAERRQQKRRQQQLLIAASFFVVAIIGVVLYALVNAPAEAPIPAGSLERYEGVTVSTTERGYPRLGETQNTVRVVEYSSFACPACRDFHETVFPSLLERVKRREISFTFIPLTTGSIANPQGAARAALCAGEQGKFWPYHDALFNWQGTYGNQAFSGNRLITGIRNLPLNVDQWNTCMGSDRIAQIMQAAENEAKEALNNAVETPAITIDGVAYSADLDSVNTAIDQRLRARGINPGGVQPTLPESTAEVEPRPTRTLTAEE